MLQATMSTAVAITGVLANKSVLGPEIAIPLAAAMGALGAAQIAMISKQQYTPRETGGSVFGNKAYVTSEGGPELFVPGRSGTMISQKEIMEGLTGSNERGGGTNVNLTIQALDAKDAVQVLSENRGVIINMFREEMDRSFRN